MNDDRTKQVVKAAARDLGIAMNLLSAHRPLVRRHFQIFLNQIKSELIADVSKDLGKIGLIMPLDVIKHVQRVLADHAKPCTHVHEEED